MTSDTRPASEQAHPASTFWLYWTGSTVSGLGTAVTSVALPLTAVLVLHAAAFGVAAVSAAGNLPWLVFGLPAGAYVTRLPLRAVQVAMDLVRAGAIASIPLTASLGVLTLAQLIGVAVLVGSASVLFAVANSTLVPELVSADELTKRNSMIFASRGIAQLSGPSLGGVLVQLLGAASCMLLDAGSYLISAVSLALLPARTRSTHAPGKPPRLMHQVAEGIAFIRERPALRAMAALQVCVNLTGAAILTLTPLCIVRSLHEHPFVLGLVYAAEGAGALAGAALAPRISEGLGDDRVLLRCTLPVPLTVMLLGLAFHGWGAVLYGLGITAFTATLTIVAVVMQTLRQRTVAAEMLPRVVATTSSLASGGALLGALVAGALAAGLGVHAALYAVAVLSVSGPACIWASSEFRSGSRR